MDLKVKSKGKKTKKYVEDALKMMAQTISNEKKVQETRSRIIPLRAEKLSYDYIEKLVTTDVITYIYRYTPRPVPKYLPSLQTLFYFLKDDDISVIEIPSPKGIGKTTHVLGAFHLLVKKNQEALPGGICFDPYTGKIKELDPNIFTKKEDLGKDREWILEASPKERIRNSTHLLVDNVHYVADLIEEGYLDHQHLNIIAKAILEELEEDKKIIISTESPLIAYSYLTEEDSEYNQLVKETRKELTRIEIIPPTLDSLCNFYNIKIDNKISEFWKSYSDQSPRTFVYLVNKFGKISKNGKSKKLTWNNIRKGILEKSLDDILPVKDPDIIEYVVDNPTISYNPHQILKNIRDLKITSIEDCEQRIDQLKNERNREIGTLQEYINKVYNITNNLSRIPNIEEGFAGLYGRELYNRIYPEHLQNVMNEIEVNSYQEGYSKLKSLKEKKEKRNREYGREIGNYIEILYVISQDLYRGLEGEDLEEKLSKVCKIYNEVGRIKNQKFNKLLNDYLGSEFNKGSYLLEIAKGLKIKL